MTAEDVDVHMAVAVGLVLERGAQPRGLYVGTKAYRVLVARDGLGPRCIGKHVTDTLRAKVLGFDLTVDCASQVADDNAACTYTAMETGRA